MYSKVHYFQGFRMLGCHFIIDILMSCDAGPFMTSVIDKGVLRGLVWSCFTKSSSSSIRPSYHCRDGESAGVRCIKLRPCLLPVGDEIQEW